MATFADPPRTLPSPKPRYVFPFPSLRLRMTVDPEAVKDTLCPQPSPERDCVALKVIVDPLADPLSPSMVILPPPPPPDPAPNILLMQQAPE